MSTLQPRPLRVLYVDHTAAFGGGEIALLNLVKHLDRSQVTPVVLLFSDGPLRQPLEEAGVETHVKLLSEEVVNARKDSLGGSSLLKLKAAWQAMTFVFSLRNFIRRQNIDIVHTNSLKSDILGGIAGRFAGKRVIWHVRDRIDEDYLPPKVVKIFRRLAKCIPHQVAVNSRATGLTLAPEIDRGAWRRISVVHDGTFLRDNPVTTLPRQGARIGLVGRITRWKGQHVFLQAAEQVLKEFPTTRIFVIGAALFDEQEYDQQIRRQVHLSGIESAVEFTGFRSDVQDLIASLDILVHASITGEPFGQVVIEGMAAAKPVIATRGGGIPEIVQDGVTGIIVPMSDAKAMADAMKYLLEHPARAAGMGIAGRQRVAEKFTLKHVAKRVVELYGR